ncbi:hypothetical protein cypCar_00041441, partial [Cyprinus carpio]
MKVFAEALVNNNLGDLRVQPETSGRELLLVEVTVHMAAVLLCGNQLLLKPLQQLALSPNNMTAAFIPTMPDDMLAAVRQAMGGVQWYTCPNGHPWIVDMSVMQIIKPAVPDPGPFLMAHLLKDMEQLRRALGKGVDDTDLEQQLKKVNELIREDERVSSNAVMKLTFGKPELFLSSLSQNSLIHNSTIWSCRRKVSLLSLAHTVEQNNGRDTLPILWRFLQREAELRLVRFLPDILVLQRDLVKKFQNMTDLPFKTIEEFLDSHKQGEIKLPAEYTQEDLGLDADLQVLLPQRHGLGLCSTALVSYLIALHNNLVYTVEKHTREES